MKLQSDFLSKVGTDLIGRVIEWIAATVLPSVGKSFLGSGVLILIVSLFFLCIFTSRRSSVLARYEAHYAILEPVVMERVVVSDIAA